MADKAISALPTATELNASDLFVLSQSNTAKNTTWQTIIGYLTTALDGHGGIQSIAKTSTSGLVDTYTVTLADNTTYTFPVTNGNGIASITKTGTSGLVDTYTITYTNGNTSTITLTNGNGVVSVVKTPAEPPSITDTYRINFADGTHYDFTLDNGKSIETIVDYFGASNSSSTEPGSYSTTPPTLSASNKYLWHYQVITFNDESTIETTHAVEGAYGDTGDAAYVYIRYAAQEPTQDSDVLSSPNAWIGLYSGTSTTAPTSYLDYTWYQYKGDTGATGATGDYIDPVVSYGTSTAAASEPPTWYSDPSSISYSAGNFIWQKVEYTLHAAQTVQAVDKHIIGYIGQNGTGSGTLTQITFNGTAYSDDGTGNVSINVDAEDIGAIDNPPTKSNGQVLTYDSSADKWVAANPSTGNVNTVNNVGVTAGTTNIQLTGANIPVSATDNTPVANAIPALPVTIANGGTGATRSADAVSNLFDGLAHNTYIPAEDPVEDEDAWRIDFGTPDPETYGSVLSVKSDGFGTGGVGIGTLAEIGEILIASGLSIYSSSSNTPVKFGSPISALSGIVSTQTNDVLASARSMTAGTVRFFHGSGSSYTGTLPNGETTWAYGSFIALKRNSTYVQVIAVNNNSEIAVNSCNNGSTWIGWAKALALKSVTKTATIDFSPGTIGTRGYQTSWSSSSIGGTPVYAVITHVANSANYLPIAFLEGTTVYFNAYRCTTSAVSNSVVDVTIYYV